MLSVYPRAFWNFHDSLNILVSILIFPIEVLIYPLSFADQLAYLRTLIYLFCITALVTVILLVINYILPRKSNFGQKTKSITGFIMGLVGSCLTSIIGRLFLTHLNIKIELAVSRLIQIAFPTSSYAFSADRCNCTCVSSRSNSLSIFYYLPSKTQMPRREHMEKQSVMGNRSTQRLNFR